MIDTVHTAYACRARRCRRSRPPAIDSTVGGGPCACCALLPCEMMHPCCFRPADPYPPPTPAARPPAHRITFHPLAHHSSHSSSIPCTHGYPPPNSCPTLQHVFAATPAQKAQEPPYSLHFAQLPLPWLLYTGGHVAIFAHLVSPALAACPWAGLARPRHTTHPCPSSCTAARCLHCTQARKVNSLPSLSLPFSNPTCLFTRNTTPNAAGRLAVGPALPRGPFCCFRRLVLGPDWPRRPFGVGPLHCHADSHQLSPFHLNCHVCDLVSLLLPASPFMLLTSCQHCSPIGRLLRPLR